MKIIPCKIVQVTDEEGNPIDLNKPTEPIPDGFRANFDGANNQYVIAETKEEEAEIIESTPALKEFKTYNDNLKAEEEAAKIEP